MYQHCWLRKAHTILRSDDPIVFVVLQLFMFTFLYKRQTECPIRTDTVEEVVLQLNCRSEFPFPPVNLLYYGSTQTYCHFESTAKIHFLDWKYTIAPFFFFFFFFFFFSLQASFSRSVLKLGILKPFWES